MMNTNLKKRLFYVLTILVLGLVYVSAVPIVGHDGSQITLNVGNGEEDLITVINQIKTDILGMGGGSGQFNSGLFVKTIETTKGWNGGTACVILSGAYDGRVMCTGNDPYGLTGTGGQGWIRFTYTVVPLPKTKNLTGDWPYFCALLEDETTLQKIKEAMIPIGILASIGSFIIILLTTILQL